MPTTNSASFDATLRCSLSPQRCHHLRSRPATRCGRPPFSASRRPLPSSRLASDRNPSEISSSYFWRIALGYRLTIQLVVIRFGLKMMGSYALAPAQASFDNQTCNQQLTQHWRSCKAPSL